MLKPLRISASPPPRGVGLVLLLGMMGLWPRLCWAVTAQELLHRYDAIMGAESFEATFEMSAHRDDGSTRTYTMRVVKLGNDKVRLWFSAPSSVKGQEMLRQGDNAWVYVPNIRRAVRLASRESFQGGDFNNADVLRVNYEADYKPTLEADDPTVPDAYVLELHGKTSSAAYERIRLWLRKSDFMPLKADYFAGSGKLMRSGTFGDFRSFNGFRRPAKVMMKNMLDTERFSTMVVKALDTHVHPSASLFVLDNLGR